MYPPVSKPMSQQRFMLLLAGILIAIGIGLFFVDKATAAESAVPKPSCYPIFGLGEVIDARPVMADGPDVGIWWCATATGLEENYRAGEWGGICEPCFRQAIQSLSQVWELDRGRFVRPLTAREQSLLATGVKAYEPRCVASSTAKTTQVVTVTANRAISTPQVDAAGTVVRISTEGPRPSCYDWIRVSASKLYCSAAGMRDTKGRPIVNAYVACRITKAPESGWPS